MTTAGLHVEGLRVSFGDIRALNGLGLDVAPGQTVGFLGPNGAGKTTTMRAILGLLRPSAGLVHWNGQPISDAVRSRIGYMPEERGLYARMRIGEQVTYFARLTGMSGRDAKAAATRWLERLGLGGRLDATVQDLSHGNQQRVQLAVALVQDPELLILDEPFSGLDPVAVRSMSDIITERANQGAAVLFSSHQLDLVEEVCEHVVIVHNGANVARGTVSELRAASPTRLLTVGFEVRTGWRPTNIATELVREYGATIEMRVPRDIDIAAVLADARAHGRVSTFSFEPPTLESIFFEAVSR